MRAAFVISILLVLTAFPAGAQDSDLMSRRLSAEKIGGVEPGSYSAGDTVAFTLDTYGDKFLLRFEGSPEAFVLYGDRVALGGRVLKYDSGATALRISVWGGMTVYTGAAPSGLPATRTGDAPPLPRPAVSSADLTSALSDESAHLSYVQQMTLHFSADPSVLAGNDDVRALAFDTLANAETGIERVVAGAAGRAAFGKRIDEVRIAESDKPRLAIAGRVLVVSFAPSQGLAGRASSRAIAFALGKLLSVSEPN